MDWSFFFFLISMLFGLGLSGAVFYGAVSSIRDEKYFGGWKLWVSAALFALLQFGFALAGYGISGSLAGHSGMENSLLWAALFLSLYFGGKMILEGLRTLRRGEISLEKQLRASERPMEAKPGMTAEEAVPGRTVTRTRVSDKIPVLWKVFLKAFAASGGAFAAGFSIPKMPFVGALAESGIIFFLTFIFALCGLLRGQDKDVKIPCYLEILGGVLLIAAMALTMIRQFTA